MKKLTKESFLRARYYLMNHGRDIEQALFRFYFEDGSKEEVISVLDFYQGENGGFRNMGEGGSLITNGIDTTMAFQYLTEIGASAKDSIVQKGIHYFIDTYDHVLKGWHAWPGRTSTSWVDNPNAEIVGYLYEYRELVPDEFLHEVTEQALSCMSTIHTTDEPHQFYFLSALCHFRLAERIDKPYKSRILKQLEVDIEDIIETDGSKWSTTYCAKPFFFAHSPSSPLYHSIKPYVIQSLENEVMTQGVEGNFILNWNVDEAGDRVWKSIWTLDVLGALYLHGMIEEMEYVEVK
ncbi:hypothetical protein GCM10008967_30230 [Bacillus carboniphilus]|uniref:Uncharacterized protein n=1 Tax=Bacillus carboniphilus TaxID=86663 RepID=A0ABP3G6Y0_9BACI